MPLHHAYYEKHKNESTIMGVLGVLTTIGLVATAFYFIEIEPLENYGFQTSL